MSRLAQQQPEGFLRVTLGYQEIFELQPTWDQLIARLQKYSIAQVLGCLGRISAVLNQLDRRHAEAQKRVCDGIFGDISPAVWAGVLTWLRKERESGAPPGTPALFHELQLINLAKVAFLSLDTTRAETTESLVELGEALLMLNNLQEGVLGNHPGADPSTPEGAQVWHQHFMANGLFHHGDTEVHVFPRAYDLYLSDKPQLRSHPSYVDLPVLVRGDRPRP